MKSFTALIFFAACIPLAAQIGPGIPLTFEAFRQRLNEEHPMISVASIREKAGEAGVMAARGAFDPLIRASLAEKQLNDIDYYSYSDASLIIQTPSPLRLYSSYTRNAGQYINPPDITPSGGLFRLGISIPLWRRLLTDEQRAGLKYAKAMNAYNRHVARNIKNDLRLDAYTAFWRWWAAFERQKLFGQLEALAYERLQAVRSRAMRGDLPWIDTLEANMQWQNRVIQRTEAQAAQYRLQLAAMAFLMETSGNLSGDQYYYPDAPFELSGTFAGVFQVYSPLLEKNHPALNQFSELTNARKVEIALKREMTKPAVDLNVNLLRKSLFSDGEAWYAKDNYNWGISLSYPLFNRKARGQLELENLALGELLLQSENLTVQLKNRAQNAFRQIQYLQEQFSLASANLTSLQVLLAGERTKFDNGESSLLLINLRETAYADAWLKLIELQSGLLLAEVEMKHALGILD